MSVVVQCECGKKIKAKDEQIGMRFKCRKCGRINEIKTATRPAPEDERQATPPEDSPREENPYQPESQLSTPGYGHYRRGQSSRWPWVLGIAAIVFILVVGGAIFLAMGPSRSYHKIQVGMSEKEAMPLVHSIAKEWSGIVIQRVFMDRDQSGQIVGGQVTYTNGEQSITIFFDPDGKVQSKSKKGF